VFDDEYDYDRDDHGCMDDCDRDYDNFFEEDKLFIEEQRIERARREKEIARAIALGWNPEPVYTSLGDLFKEAIIKKASGK
jgi:hypothetical protein